MYAATHTPVKRPGSQKEPEKLSPKMELGPNRPGAQTSVRRSVGEWEETGKGRPPAEKPKTPSPPRKAAQVGAPRPKPVAMTISMQETRMTGRRPSDSTSPKSQEKFPNRTAEAKACLMKAKANIELSRNLRSDIKANVLAAIERLYALTKEAEEERLNAKPDKTTRTPEMTHKSTQSDEAQSVSTQLTKRIEEHSELLKESNRQMGSLREAMKQQSEMVERTTTYASVAAAPPGLKPKEQHALHSLVVSSVKEGETGEEVIGIIRDTVNAKAGGIKIDRVRKARDGRVIVGCRTVEERAKVYDRLKGAEVLKVEEMRNKDPLLILRDVVRNLTDDEILTALRNQNGSMFRDLAEDQSRMEIRYRKPARNSQLCHVVMRVSPRIWNLMTQKGAVHVDLQRIKVADQSPLMQCSMCLGYGHGRRTCKETVPICSHCGGLHMKSECPDWVSGVPPTCRNCTRAKNEHSEHNAFSAECAVRRRWDAMARASVAYC